MLQTIGALELLHSRSLHRFIGNALLPQYYDMPTLSVRNAVFSLLQADVAPFKAGRIVSHSSRYPLHLFPRRRCSVLRLCR